jgi:hypothetical protein
MVNDSPPSIEQAIEQEEARLLARLAKIAEFKRLARELDFPVSGIAPSVAAIQQPQESQQPDPTRSEPSVEPAFDGTFGGLISVYRTHKRSTYHQLKHNVRSNYDQVLNRLVKEVGQERVADWNAQRIKDEYEKSWAAAGKVSMGRTIARRVRLLCGFGSTVLNDDACLRLSAIMGNMKFPASNSNEVRERLTRDHVRAIRFTAREHFGWDSIALAQAFQTEFPKLRQMDVIGEWVPISEPGTSEIVKGNEKWVRGLRWSDIDENMVLRRVLTSGRRDQHKEIAYNLKRSAMVMEEINRVPLEKRKGPMIICEYSNIPWSSSEFRRKWRIVAAKAGVPASITNSAQPPEDDEEPELGADSAL